MKKHLAIFISFLLAVIICGCSGPGAEQPVTGKPNYKITFDKNDTGATGNMTPQIIATGAIVKLKACGFVKSDFSFNGWASTSTGEPEYTDEASYTMGDTNVILYAKWKALVFYTVTFDSQGGSQVTPKKVVTDSLISEPSAPFWAAHALEGWYKESDFINRWDFNSDILIGNITLYAKWLECTDGLSYMLIYNKPEYGVSKGTANTNGSVIIPEYWAGKKVTLIVNSAFQFCSNITSLSIPNSITSISPNAFLSCTSLNNINLPNNLTDIGDSAFCYCTALTNLTIPNSVTSLGYGLVQACPGLQSITIPDNITTLGNYFFSGCHSLENITIPSKVTSIGIRAFEYCTNLKEVIANPVKPPVATVLSGELLFLDNAKLTAIRVPADSVAAYKAAVGWSKYSSLIVSN